MRTFAPTRCSRAARGAGFTLLEMLVALAILALAGIALLRLDALSLHAAADLDARQIATITARNLALERLTDPNPPALGSTEGMVVNAGRTLRWRQEVRRMPDPRLLAVSVLVRPGGGQAPAVLTIVRPAI